MRNMEQPSVPAASTATDGMKGDAEDTPLEFDFRM